MIARFLLKYRLKKLAVSIGLKALESVTQRFRRVNGTQGA